MLDSKRVGLMIVICRKCGDEFDLYEPSGLCTKCRWEEIEFDFKRREAPFFFELEQKLKAQKENELIKIVCDLVAQYHNSTHYSAYLFEHEVNEVLKIYGNGNGDDDIYTIVENYFIAHEAKIKDAQEIAKSARASYLIRHVCAIVLCFLGFLGIAGLHRMAIGKVGTGIIYLLTFGLFGIGTLYDLLSLIFGIFLDSEGNRV
jgi:hypothetical protein